MYAIEFEADAIDGMIKLPAECMNLNNKHIKLIALLDEKPQALLSSQLTDEYVRAHWRDFIMTASTTPQQDDDLVLQEEYGDYLNAKHSN